MNDLITQTTTLPANIEDLSKFVLIGREKLEAVRAEIRAIKKVKLAEEVLSQKKDEAKLLSFAVLDAEVRLGELFKEIPKDTANNNPSGLPKVTQRDSGIPLGRKSKIDIINNLGFSKKQAQRLETLADNQDLLEQVKQEALENDDIPTRARVIDLAKARREQEEGFNKTQSFSTRPR